MTESGQRAAMAIARGYDGAATHVDSFMSLAGTALRDALAGIAGQSNDNHPVRLAASPSWRAALRSCLLQCHEDRTGGRSDLIQHVRP